MPRRHRILSFLVCITLVTAFFACASTPTRQGTGEYVDDSAITTKVKAAILNEPTLKVFQIRGVTGVKSVKNNLIVK
jgi:osmotically-inducible protein OsmY